MVEERGRAEEPFLAHFAFVRAFGQVAVRLSRGDAFDAGNWYVAFHFVTSVKGVRGLELVASRKAAMRPLRNSD
jgi:hypothetical protein